MNPLLNLTQKVEAVLATEPQSRNSDITLTQEIWKKYHTESLIYHPNTNEPFVKLSHLFDLPREDNIKRIRAKIQNEERRYLPTDPKVFYERARLSNEWKQFLGYNVNWTDETWVEKCNNYLNRPPEQTSFI